MYVVVVLRSFLGVLCLYTFTTGTNAGSFLWLDPPRVVVRYGDPVSVNCSTNLDKSEIAWEIPLGGYSKTGPKMATWTVKNVTEWGIKPQCYVNTDEHQDLILLSVTIYKTPDSVSISTVGNPGPMTEGGQYELQCDVKNVAPVKFLTVDWYKGDTLVNKTAFNDHKEIPVDLSSRLQISPSRDDNGAQYRCEAKLDLGPEGPQPPPTVMSDPLITTVYYKPIIHKSKLPEVVPVFRGYSEVLVCEAEGNPLPTITWTTKTNTEVDNGNLTIIEATNENAGMYNCTASNSVGTDFKEVEVIMKEDYLPLIAGFVALVVVITSASFFVIYFIYYKNTKMGHYSVETAKPSSENGNVAEKSMNKPLPMKKISEKICV